MYHKCFISAAVLCRGFRGHENCGGFFFFQLFFFLNVLTVSPPKKKHTEREREREELTDTRLSCASVGVGERRPRDDAAPASATLVIPLKLETPHPRGSSVDSLRLSKLGFFFFTAATKEKRNVTQASVSTWERES